MEYLPALTPKVIQNNPNVGKYSIHGSLGFVCLLVCLFVCLCCSCILSYLVESHMLYERVMFVSYMRMFQAPFYPLCPHVLNAIR